MLVTALSHRPASRVAIRSFPLSTVTSPPFNANVIGLSPTKAIFQVTVRRNQGRGQSEFLMERNRYSRDPATCQSTPAAAVPRSSTMPHSLLEGWRVGQRLRLRGRR
jgi:hypothetical protein